MIAMASSSMPADSSSFGAIFREYSKDMGFNDLLQLAECWHVQHESIARLVREKAVGKTCVK